MLVLSIPDMNCSHCKAAVQQALSAVDPEAEIAVDLEAHRVTVRTTADAERLIDSLATVGYPASLVV